MASAATPASRTPLARLVERLAIVNVIVLAGGLVTGPLLARALGPDGRGDLAAILVPLYLAPVLLSLAAGAYPSVESAKGRDAGVLFGSMGGILLVVGLIATAAAYPVATFLADGRETVQTWLIVGFCLLPLTLPALVLLSILGGRAMWSTVVTIRLLQAALPLVAICVLFVIDELTVASAAAVTVGGVAVTLPLHLRALAGAGKVRFDRVVARTGLAFGAKAWIGGLAATMNTRVDQLLMIKLVSPRELGLYAIAVTLASLPNVFVGAIGQPLTTRVAAGEQDLLPRAVRVTVLTTTIASAGVAATAPVLLPVLFGEEFTDAVPLVAVLSISAVPLAIAMVLGPGLIADGAPSIGSIAEVIALVLTFAGLALLLPALGAMGAAIVSVVAYTASAIVTLAFATRRLGRPMRDFVVPDRDDVGLLLERLRVVLLRRPA